MAKKKRRKSKKNKGNITLIVMLAVIFLIIGIFVLKAINKGDTGADATTTTNDGEYAQGVDVSTDDEHNDSSYENEDDTTNEDTPSQPESTTFEVLTEQTTEATTSTISNISPNVVDAIIDYYTDLMGFPRGALFIKDSETDESATEFTYTLRLNANGSPNELVGDVHVEKGTGRVTDSMGNEPWYIEE